MDNILRLVGSRIKDIRRSTGLSQDQLGEKCGFHYSYVGGVERGERNVSLENLSKIADALHVDLKEFFDFDAGNPNNEKDQALDEIFVLLRSLDARKIRMTKNLLHEILSAYSDD